MFKIVRFPTKLEPFFHSLKSFFHWDHFSYFRTLVLLFAFAWGRRNTSNLYQYLDAPQHRTRFNNFFLILRWDPAAALRQTAFQSLNSLKPQPGEILYLIIDSTLKEKRGNHMEAVCKLRDPSTGRYFMGHHYVEAALYFRGIVIPLGIRLYVKKEDCLSLKTLFQKSTQIAANLIREFIPPEGLKVIVLFDSYFLCRTVLKACRHKGFRFISTLKSNRNIYKNGRKLKAGKYGCNLFYHSTKQTTRVTKENGLVTYRFVDAGWLSVSKVGLVRVIFSQKNSSGEIKGLVTDEPDFSARQVITGYDGRWMIEVFNKDAKQLLGLGQYQNLPREAAVIHLHLVCFAYALLTHLAIKAEGDKGKRKSAVKVSTASLQNELRRIVWEDLSEYLKELPSGDLVIKELERLLVA
jgi:hypothetical protein